MTPDAPSAPFDCATCGACCREAFDAVPIEASDEAVLAHPELVVVASDGGRQIRRVPSPLSPPVASCTRCAALDGDGSDPAPFRCRIYAERPAACSGLDVGSEACTFARGRVGLSAGVA